MSVFSLLMKNGRLAPTTLRIPHQVPHPKSFRGPVKIQTEKCVACGMCAYVCVSGAIKVADREDHCEWTYSPGQCTFCGRCAESCAGEALSMMGESAPPYSQPEELKEVHRISYPICPECGRPTPPVSESMLRRAYKEITEQIRSRGLLCRRCRLRRSQKDLWATPRKAIPSESKQPECEANG